MKAKQKSESLIPSVWYALTEQEVFKKLKTSKKGLSKEETFKRLEKYGKNEIVKKKKTPWILKFLKQLIHHKHQE